MEVQRHGLGQIVALPAKGGGHTGIVGHIRIGRCIDEHLGIELIEAPLGEDLRAGDGTVFHFAAGKHGMVQQCYAAFHGHILPDDLHALGIKGRGGRTEAHTVRHMSGAEAPADHFPGHLLGNAQNNLFFSCMEGHLRARAGSGHGTSQIGMLLDQNGFRTQPGAGNGRNGTGRAAADDCHIKVQLLHDSDPFLLPIHSISGQRHGRLPRTGPGCLSFPASAVR